MNSYISRSPDRSPSPPIRGESLLLVVMLCRMYVCVCVSFDCGGGSRDTTAQARVDGRCGGTGREHRRRGLLSPVNLNRCRALAYSCPFLLFPCALFFLGCFQFPCLSIASLALSLSRSLAHVHKQRPLCLSQQRAKLVQELHDHSPITLVSLL